MQKEVEKVLRAGLDDENYTKLARLPNPKLHRFVAEAVSLCKPGSVFVCTDSPQDIAHIREQAKATGEEKALKIEGHTVHFDGYNDQARDKANTKYLIPPGVSLGANLNSKDKAEGLEEVLKLLEGSMSKGTMIVRFFSLGPTNSEFSVCGVQLTDSFYVAHSEDLLYRSGYEQFRQLGGREDFFRVLHSAGELKDCVSSNPDKRRIYIDIEEDIVYSVNTQYAGNTVGFKKLCLRLAIRKADSEGWLAEHMFVMGARGPGGRTTYFTGAFPSACGKTSTAMIPGETIIGDDIAYLKIVNEEARAVNVESGIFGIIRDVNKRDDPLIWNAITRPGEVIFSNILVAEDEVPYWLGDGRETPEKGVNYSGAWTPGKKDAGGKEISHSHRNARYTLRLNSLPNCDPVLDGPDGVRIGGIIYGGRDSDTWVPAQQSFDWAHGVITMGACLESETTAAALGKEGVRTFQPMANLDFVSIPLGRYIQNHLDFAKGLSAPPVIFAVNYFLKDKEGNYLNDMADKNVWLKWLELRVNGEAEAVKTPTGYIPAYQDLKRLFAEVLAKDYTSDQYVEQYTLRIPENLAKLDRIEQVYRTNVPDTPEVVFDVLAEQRERLVKTKQRRGDYVSPSLTPA